MGYFVCASVATVKVILDCARIRNPILAQIDHLARLELGLRRSGCEMRLAHPSDDLLGLIDLAGLAGLLRVEVERKAEEREQPGGVEEEGELPDAPA